MSKESMKSRKIRIAAILACHNRRAFTLACLEALFSQTSDTVAINAFLLDDGSTDGTSEAVKERFGQTQVIEADGSYFWNEGMRTAFAAALEAGADFYLWLNDDTHLYDYAIETLLSAHAAAKAQGAGFSLIVGSVQDPDSDALTYGGMIRNSRWHPFHYELVQPEKSIVRCDVMHGNCVLIPDEVARLTGNMDAGYSHAIGDIDYALKVRKKGATVWIAPGFVGRCTTNPVKGSWLDTSLPLKERWKQMRGPKGLPPSDWLLFSRKHAGWLWPVFGFSPYVRLVLSAIKTKFTHKRLHPIV